jgi:hypothetical protein
VHFKSFIQPPLQFKLGLRKNVDDFDYIECHLNILGNLDVGIYVM